MSDELWMRIHQVCRRTQVRTNAEGKDLLKTLRFIASVYPPNLMLDTIQLEAPTQTPKASLDCSSRSVSLPKAPVSFWSRLSLRDPPGLTEDHHVASVPLVWAMGGLKLHRRRWEPRPGTPPTDCRRRLGGGSGSSKTHANHY